MPADRATPAVAAALAAHPTVGYVQVAASPTPPEWLPLAEIVADIGPWLARVAPRTGGDRPATAAFFLAWTARAIVALPATMLASDDRALVAGLDDVRLRVAEGGWATGIAIAGGRVAVAAGDALASKRRTRDRGAPTGAERLRPVIERVSAEGEATSLRARRTGCCLALRFPGGKLCDDCPITVRRTA